VTDFLVAGKSPTDAGPISPDLYQTPDSSILGLPLNLEPGQTHRITLLLVYSKDPQRKGEVYLVTSRGGWQLVAFDWREMESRSRARRGDSAKSSLLTPDFEEVWQVQLRFVTALGASAEYVAPWVIRHWTLERARRILDSVGVAK